MLYDHRFEPCCQVVLQHLDVRCTLYRCRYRHHRVSGLCCSVPTNGFGAVSRPRPLASAMSSPAVCATAATAVHLSASSGRRLTCLSNSAPNPSRKDRMRYILQKGSIPCLAPQKNLTPSLPSPPKTCAFPLFTQTAKLLFNSPPSIPQNASRLVLSLSVNS